MDDILIIDGYRMKCRVSYSKDVRNNYVSFFVESSYDEVKKRFVDNAVLKLDYDGDIVELEDFRFLHSITDRMNNIIEVTYRKMTDLEKLIMIAYGGIN